ncbi:MAG: hypothetical protein ACR2MC_13110, partial [Actinomycetota bacterium]
MDPDREGARIDGDQSGDAGWCRGDHVADCDAQTMDEITDYLATIDEKLDGVLRAQTNQVLARMDGVDLAIMGAMSVREAVGR